MKKVIFVAATAVLVWSILLLLGCPSDGPGNGAAPVPVGCGNVFGYDTDDDDSSFSNGALIAVSFSVAESQSINTLACKFSTTTGGNFSGMGVYSDNSGEPGALLAETGKGTTVAGWRSSSIPTTDLTAGTTYWLAVIGDWDGPAHYTAAGVGVKFVPHDYVSNDTLPSNPTGWNDIAGADVKVYATLICL